MHVDHLWASREYESVCGVFHEEVKPGEMSLHMTEERLKPTVFIWILKTILT